MKNIAVLLTCYNRKEKTINCLKSFYNAHTLSESKINVDIYLVNDGSTDGTEFAVRENFSRVKIITGSGSLFWAGGMRLAWEVALNNEQVYDSFLLLNDDVILIENFLNDLITTHNYCIEHFNQSGIYVCSTRSLINSRITYGGTLITSKCVRLKSKRINPTNVPTPCSMANANILMVTLDVVKAIGILDPKYIHQFADYDYTLLATKQGIPLLVCPGFGGFCENNNTNNWFSSNSSIYDRINFLYSPLGLAYKEQLYYLKKNFKFQLPYYFMMLWLKTLFPFIWEKHKRSRTQIIV